MPMRIADTRIRQFVSTQQSSPAPRISDANVIDLLAAVGDGSRHSFDSAKAALTKPGITRAQQFELAKAGLSKSEKSDLGQLLDQSGLAMDVGAKNFLEALLGRAPLQETFGPLTITGDQKNGIQGLAKPGQIIEHRVLFQVPWDMPMGEYKVMMGLYRKKTGERLKIIEGGNDGQNRLELGPFEITKLSPPWDELIPRCVPEVQRKYPERIIDSGRWPSAGPSAPSPAGN